jgi:outer membrane protein TolC
VVNIIAAVNNNYFNIVRRKQQLKAIEEQISISEERVKLADRKLTVGLGAKPELLQAQLDLNEQRSARLRELATIDQLKQQLNQLMAVETKSMYEVVDSIPINTQLILGDLSSEMLKSNPGLLQARKNIDIARISLKERKAEQYPILSFNSAYNFNRLENKVVINNFTPLFNRNRGFNYGFGITMPILNGFNTRRLIGQAKLDIAFQELSYRNQLSMADMSLQNAFKAYEMQKQALKLEEDNINLARENVNIALERFRQGVSTFIELRVAQISLAEAYNRLIAARYDTKLAEIELLRLKGDIVP